MQPGDQLGHPSESSALTSHGVRSRPHLSTKRTKASPSVMAAG
ncbi:MAG: hypothetical protein AVDCRST_MAG66-2886 [uncultured Pseudonocardia sp.]|uniref:Uncharacterized protein n=1 Tax=uncultured Pseudonocardia sp. TaxID=211455 RepID=A0A6J4PWH4_9PSEU|nr:MAG: hypothetical protein AVDCRST_MAG66-2886 [uncultured Pseudonocardia sp.]